MGTRFFRRAITLPADRKVKRATLLFTADNSGDFFVNGRKAGSAGNFHLATDADVTGLLHAGENALSVSVDNGGPDPNPAGLIALVRVEFEQGAPLVVVTDSGWKAAAKPGAGWMTAGFDDQAWPSALALGPVVEHLALLHGKLF